MVCGQLRPKLEINQLPSTVDTGVDSVEALAFGCSDRKESGQQLACVGLVAEISTISRYRMIELMATVTCRGSGTTRGEERTGTEAQFRYPHEASLGHFPTCYIAWEAPDSPVCRWTWTETWTETPVASTETKEEEFRSCKPASSYLPAISMLALLLGGGGVRM